ncbi:MAG: inorganic diphosphatase [Patescibacteria group bacterium]
MSINKPKIGDKAPEELNILVEIPLGEIKKFELNPRTNSLEAERVLATTLPFPFNYGFIPETLADDGDALDAMILSNQILAKGRIAVGRPVSILKMTDEHGRDNKILVVPVNETDENYSRINDLTDLTLPMKEKISLFFKHYKETEKDRWSKVYEFGDKAEAIAAIRESINKYQK